ncbi:hypothetical protein ACSVIJ_24705, partial [Pseudomonas sp. NCHU5208]|uniref:hypothetical protein n=1 Tax=unclassified Pseudomonas TaxID=196821 RepID=UPI003F997625
QPGPDDRAEGFGYFARKVTRPGGRNQKHQQKRGNPEQAPETPTQYCQSGINQAFPQEREEPF